MNRAAPLIFFLTLVVTIAPRATAQDSLGRARSVPDFSQDSTSTILSGVPLDGVFYFIRIVPLGRNFPDRMPIYNPERKRSAMRADSLHRLLPDTLLKLLPRREKEP